jgi:DNA-binding transcriptional LysR family regulator
MKRKKPQPQTITQRHIEVYDVVATTGSTLGASVRLGLSQASVSRMLAQLEAYLGMQLFDRAKNRLVPTREGLFLGPRIRAISSQFDTLRIAARELSDGNSGAMLLRIAVPGSLTNKTLPTLLSSFLQKNSEARFEITLDTYVGIERMIADGEVEIGLLTMPMRTSGLTAQFSIQSETVCVVPKNHRLASKKRLSLREISEHPLILLARGRAARLEVENAFNREGIQVEAKIETHSVGSACNFVAHGLGISLVNRLMAGEFTHLPIALVKLEVDIQNHYSIATKKGLPLSKTGALFLDHLKEHFAKKGR